MSDRQPGLFDGPTIDLGLDAERLRTLAGRVWHLMRDGGWRTLQEIREQCGGGCSEAGISARLRDFRKHKWGGHTVRRRRRGDGRRGLFEYQVEVKP